MTHIHGIYYGTLDELLALNEKLKKEECQMRLVIPLDITTAHTNIDRIEEILPRQHNNIRNPITTTMKFIISMQTKPLIGGWIKKASEWFELSGITIFDDQRKGWTKSPTFTIIAHMKDGFTKEGVENL